MGCLARRAFRRLWLKLMIGFMSKEVWDSLVDGVRVPWIGREEDGVPT